MNINYAQGLALLVLACVVHTNCGKSNSKFKKPNEEEVDAKSVNGKNGRSKRDNKRHGKNIEQPAGPVEKMLLNIATVIQGCVDERTMNNKDFKKKLDNLYDDLVRPAIDDLISKNYAKVEKIKTKYEEDKQILLIMQNGNDNNKSKPKTLTKKSQKEKRNKGEHTTGDE